MSHIYDILINVYLVSEYLKSIQYIFLKIYFIIL